MSNNTQNFYVGTYSRDAGLVSGEHSSGIYYGQLDLDTGALQVTAVTDSLDNPSFLALHPNGQFLYAVNEVDDFEGQSSGAVSAFAINPDDGGLTFINQRPTQGAHPCHLVVDQTGRFVMAANYSGGSIVMYPLGEDGSLGEASDFVQHEGSSVNPNRQEAAHAHSFTLSGDNRFGIVADLGMDKVVVYEMDYDARKFKLQEAASAKIYDGGGPRHFAFAPDNTHAYVINELDATITVFDYDTATGTLTETQTLSTVPSDFTGPKSTADIHISPSGKFVYGSNRGHDTIAMFAVDTATGQLTAIGHQSTLGKIPRNFALNPEGTFLLAANQDSDNIVSFRLDPDEGTLTPTGHQVQVSRPVCIQFT
ncbi:MAG: lactonase family protein [Chloroflexota bacterium]